MYQYESGMHVYDEGDPEDALFLVLTGKVVGSTKETGPCVVYGQGDTFGERCILANSINHKKKVLLRPCTVTAEMQTELLRIPSTSLVRYEQFLTGPLYKAIDSFEHRTDPLKGNKIALFAYLVFLVIFTYASFGAYPTAELYHQNKVIGQLGPFVSGYLDRNLSLVSNYVDHANIFYKYLKDDLLPITHTDDAGLQPGMDGSMQLITGIQLRQIRARPRQCTARESRGPRHLQHVGHLAIRDGRY
eukprot:SAG31_NODE_6105_length_2170_cov_1.536939_2_plen_246_part_00